MTLTFNPRSPIFRRIEEWIQSNYPPSLCSIGSLTSEIYLRTGFPGKTHTQTDRDTDWIWYSPHIAYSLGLSNNLFFFVGYKTVLPFFSYNRVKTEKKLIHFIKYSPLNLSINRQTTCYFVATLLSNVKGNECCLALLWPEDAGSWYDTP